VERIAGLPLHVTFGSELGMFETVHAPLGQVTWQSSRPAQSTLQLDDS
jgi:hypothetical protein